MSVNYYYRKTETIAGQRVEDERHIGLSAGGMFLFQAYPEQGLTTAKAWIKHLEDGATEIIDEYDKVVPLGEFVAFVEQFRNLLDKAEYRNSPVMLTEEVLKGVTRYRDAEGYLFATYNFS